MSSKHTALHTIPLFPLSSVLFPHARLPMQIFEPRYIDLIKDCLKGESGFGVVWLREGREVAVPAESYQPKLAEVGVYAKIVDWDALPDNRLGVTIEGLQKFRIERSWRQANQLNMAQVSWIDPEPIIPLPDNAGDLQGLLQQLTQHPHVANLNISADIDDVDSLGCILSQLLPIDEAIKYSLLASMDSLTRLEELMELLEEMGR